MSGLAHAQHANSQPTLSERADALEEHMMHELEHIVTKSVLFGLADGKVAMESGPALMAKNPGKYMLMGADPRLPPMPEKPTPIAAQRRGPTHSPSTGPASAATRNGVANVMVSAWSSWSHLRAKKFRMVEPSSSAERPICRNGRALRSMPGRLSGLDHWSASRKPKV